MDIFTSVDKLQEQLKSHKNNDQSIGFVPTLGALHQGHLSLIQHAKETSDVVVASIFVNPTQFDDKSDFENYPKTIEQDIALLQSIHCDYLFLPTLDEVYPNGPILTEKYALDSLENILEGATRPGHYQGVAQVVHRLLNIVQPNFLFLGQKDYQQVLIIRNMIIEKQIPTEVVMCPIVREEDGLAMSSRNRRLSPQAREVAPELYKTLLSCKTNYKDFTVAELKEWAMANLNAEPLIQVDYIAFCNADNLEIIHDWSEAKNALVLGAIFLDPIRLIDNIIIY